MDKREMDYYIQVENTTQSIDFEDNRKNEIN